MHPHPSQPSEIHRVSPVALPAALRYASGRSGRRASLTTHFSQGSSNMRRIVGIGCFLAALALLSVPIIAQDKKNDKPGAMGDKAGKPGAEDQQKMMEDYMKNVGTPDEHHAQ